MFLNSNFSNKSSLVKPIAIAVVILLIIGGFYHFSSDKNKEASDEKNAQSAAKPSGIDQDKRVRKVEDVEEVIVKWVEANPEVIINSVMNMQRKAAEEQTKNAQKNIGPKKDDLLNDKNSPSHAPNGYNVTIVEFFDYNCGYCKKANTVVEALIKSDAKVRLIYKEFPILGQLSEEMSIIAIAASMVDFSSYKKVHDAFMDGHPQNKEEILKLLRNSTPNAAKIENLAKTQKNKIMEIINSNRSLGSSIGVNGTPGFVIGEELIPGAIELATFQQKIAEQRK